jgi:thiol-disulfide isomerase/thioredoxin
MKTTIGKVYAKWCGYCKVLKPEWDIMKRTLKKNKDVEIVQVEINQTAKLNKLKKKYPDLVIKGYPTIFKIDNNGIQYYSGERLANDMTNWALEGHSKKPYTKKNIKKTRNTKKVRFFDLF